MTDSVRICLRDKEYRVKAGISVHHALKKIDVDPQAVLATKDGELITDDIILRAGDVIKLIAVISGGRV